MFINKTIIKALCVNVSHYLQVTFSFPPHRPRECGGPEWLTTSKLKANLRLYYHDHKKLISTEASPNVTCGRAGQQSFSFFSAVAPKIALMYKRIGVYHTCGIFSSRRRLISDKVSFVPSKFQFINRFPEIFPTKTAPQHHLRSFPYRPRPGHNMKTYKITKFLMISKCVMPVLSLARCILRNSGDQNSNFGSSALSTRSKRIQLRVSLNELARWMLPFHRLS